MLLRFWLRTVAGHGCAACELLAARDNARLYPAVPQMRDSPSNIIRLRGMIALHKALSARTLTD
eukprot:3845973-Pleurochrysis_carterae.AAC.1